MHNYLILLLHWPVKWINYKRYKLNIRCGEGIDNIYHQSEMARLGNHTNC